MPYLPNLAAMDDALYEKSVQVLCDMLRRSEMLGASGLVTHPGHGGFENKKNLPEGFLMPSTMPWKLCGTM